jgi:hypothetical protein
VLGAKRLSAPGRAKPPPPIIRESDAAPAAQKLLEARRVAELRFDGQSILGSYQFAFKQFTAIASMAVKRVLRAELNWFAEADQDLRQPLLPEDVFNRHGHEQGALRVRRKMSKAGLKSRWALASIRKLTLGSYPQCNHP